MSVSIRVCCWFLIVASLSSRNHVVYGVSPFHDFENEEEIPGPLDAIGESLNDSFWSFYLPTAANPLSSCGQALEQMLDDLERDDVTPSHKMVDSWGKTASGWRIGITYFLGVYDECKNIVSTNRTFGGKYCKIKLSQTTTPNKGPKRVAIGLPIFLTDFFDYRSANVNDTSITYSTCIPDVCTALQLWSSLDEYLLSDNQTNFVVQSVDCELDRSESAFTAGDIAYITVCSFLGLLLVTASVMDIYIQKMGNKALGKGPLRYLLPFSAYSNIVKLFHINPKSPPGTITCLHGMRVLSMTWVVWAHQHMVTLDYTSNLYTMFDKMKGILFQTALNGFPSVDTFFLIGGFLVAYNVFKEYEKTGKFNIFMFYFHRIIRLVPPILLTAGIFATIAKFFMEGPIADYWNESVCINGWWKDALFFDNFAQRNGGEICLGQCWYLAVDSQVYLITPLIFLPIMYNEKLGMLWLYFATMVSFIVPCVINYVYDLPPTSLILDPKGSEFFNLNYGMPWCRAGPIYIGYWLGIFIQKQGKKRVKLSWWQVVCGWTVAIMTGLMVVYGVWSYNVYPRKMEYDIMTQILYGGLHRPAWGAAVGWVIFACHNGYGGFVNDLLSHPVWQPFSRLTYSTYLVALSLQFAIAVSTRTEYYFAHYQKILETVGALIIAIIPAILVSITAESPIIGLEKLLLRRPNREDDKPKESMNAKGINNEAYETVELQETATENVILKEDDESIEAVTRL